MATTSLKLSDNLRSAVALIAQEEGVTPHAFMVEAINRATVLATQRQQLIAEALAAQAQSLESKKGFTHQDVFASLRARADGKKMLPLKAKPW